MQRTTQAPLYSLHLPDQGLRPGPISGPKFSVFFVPQRKRLKWCLAWDEDTRKSFSTFSSLKTGRRMEGFGGFSANQHSAEHPVSPLYKLGLLVPIFFFVVAAGSGAASAAFLSYSNMCNAFFLCDHLWHGFFSPTLLLLSSSPSSGRQSSQARRARTPRL